MQGKGNKTTFSLPATIRPGWTSLVLSAESDAKPVFFLFRLEEGVTAEEVGDTLRRVFSTPIGPRLANVVTKLRAMSSMYGAWDLSVAPAGETSEAVVVELDPGTYGFFSFDTGSIVGTVAVEGDELNAGPPESDVRFDIADGAYEGPEQIAPGVQQVEVFNAGTTWHEFGLGRLKKGSTGADVHKLVREEGKKGRFLPAGEHIAFVGTFIGPIAEGVTVSFTQEFSPGTYWVACGVRSDESGRPHYWDGHYSFIEVTG
ncbi:MAG: hypothetical protein ACRDKA_13470 [Actinomycetota bacterium]